MNTTGLFPPVVLYVEPNRAEQERLREVFSVVLAEYDCRFASGADEASRLLDRMRLTGQEVAMILASHGLADLRGDAFLARTYEHFPTAIRMLIVNSDARIAEAFIEEARVYRIFQAPVSDIELRAALKEAVRMYIQRQELSEKSKILTELHRASMSLTGEIHLSKLLHKLMRIVIDNADAKNGYIILERYENGPLYIEASGSQGSYETEIQGIEINDFGPVCPAIVDYARKARENVILHDAINEGFFVNHPYIRKNLCRSILCTPLVYQGRLFGLLYLDNPEKTHAFSPFSLELFRLLSAPAAIAIQNAMLYSDLEQKVDERTQEVIKQKKLIESHRDEISLKNKDLIDSLKYARRIQDALLPKLTDIREVFPECFVYYRPKDIVSGDFYWFSRRLSKAIIAAADCTGHGIPGAFMTIMANTLLKQIVELEGVFKPDEILHQLHLRIKVALQQEQQTDKKNEASQDGLDMAICQVDVKRNKLAFAGANRPLVFFRNGEIHEVKPSKFGLGGAHSTDEIRDYGYTQVDIMPGDMFYIFSDGYADQIGEEDNKRFKGKRFYNLLLDIHQRDLEHQRLLLDAEYRHWRGDMEQTDDILVIGLRFP
jgi:serine phosphatase RsbU (regulator of sigma subunit)